MDETLFLHVDLVDEFLQETCKCKTPKVLNSWLRIKNALLGLDYARCCDNQTLAWNHDKTKAVCVFCGKKLSLQPRG